MCTWNTTAGGGGRGRGGERGEGGGGGEARELLLTERVTQGRYRILKQTGIEGRCRKQDGCSFSLSRDSHSFAALYISLSNLDPFKRVVFRHIAVLRKVQRRESAEKNSDKFAKPW